MSVAADAVAVVYETIVDLPLHSSYVTLAGCLGDSSLLRGTNLKAHWKHTWPPIVMHSIAGVAKHLDVCRSLGVCRALVSCRDSREQLLTLAATEGNVKASRPGIFDMLGRAKW